MPYRACALGGLPGAGYFCTENTGEGHALHTLRQKRAEGQDVLKEYGRVCALSGSAGAAWVEESVRAGGISYISQ